MDNGLLTTNKAQSNSKYQVPSTKYKALKHQALTTDIEQLTKLSFPLLHLVTKYFFDHIRIGVVPTIKEVDFERHLYPA